MQQYGVIIIICFATFFGLGGFICIYLLALKRRERTKEEKARKQAQEQENHDGAWRENWQRQRVEQDNEELKENVKQLEEQLRTKEKESKDRKDRERRKREKEDKEKQEREKKPEAQLVQPKESAGKQRGKKPGDK
jgi:hypothetical protein